MNILDRTNHAIAQQRAQRLAEERAAHFTEAQRLVMVQCGRMDHMLSRIQPDSPSSTDFLRKEAQHTVLLLQRYLAQFDYQEPN